MADRTWPCLALLMFLAACDVPGDSSVAGSQVLLHPIGDSLLSSQTSVPVHAHALSARGTELQGPAGRLDQENFEGAIGEFEGAEDETFGRLVDGHVFPDGAIAVLDASYGTARLFSRPLEPIGTRSGPGEGPGEVTDPLSLLQDPGGALGIVDGGGLKIEFFDLDPASDVAPERLRPEVSRLLDACTIDGRLFVLGLVVTDAEGLAQVENTALIHEIDSAGARVRSFSEPYPPIRYSLVADVYSNGRLACDDAAGGRIFAAYSLLGEVHAFTADGELLWIARLADFEHGHYRHEIGRSMGLDPEQELLRVDHIEHVNLVSSDLLAVSVYSRVRSESESAGWETSHSTYLMDASSGAARGGFRGESRIIGGGHGRVILYRDEPHPQFIVRGLGG